MAAIGNSADGGSTSMSVTDSTFRDKFSGRQRGAASTTYGDGRHRNADDHQLHVLPKSVGPLAAAAFSTTDVLAVRR